MDKLKDSTLLVLYAGAWKRTRAFFDHPRKIIALREELMRRGLL